MEVDNYGTKFLAEKWNFIFRKWDKNKNIPDLIILHEVQFEFK